MNVFDRHLFDHDLRLTRDGLRTVQINVGRLCNQACQHCHVGAGPGRTEIMERATAERIVDLLRASRGIETVDLTGGAPELNPSFRWLVRESRALGCEVIDRSNLTVLLEPGMGDLGAFLRDWRVRIMASLPCYTRDRVDRQRGKGTFDRSIRALRMLNELGYGREGTGLGLDLVYNPGGASLPPPQPQLEDDYRAALGDDFGIVFNHIYTITNMPIRRFGNVLEHAGALGDYQALLAGAFNPATVDGLMCRTLVSVGWDGALYDCDFNQALEIPVARAQRSIWDIESFDATSRGAIATGPHCFGCTAGAGSSCGGALA